MGTTQQILSMRTMYLFQSSLYISALKTTLCSTKDRIIGLITPILDYRCDDMRFWLSSHDCQVPTPTSQNLVLEQQIRICEAD